MKNEIHLRLVVEDKSETKEYNLLHDMMVGFMRRHGYADLNGGIEINNKGNFDVVLKDIRFSDEPLFDKMISSCKQSLTDAGMVVLDIGMFMVTDGKTARIR